jgi:hypothetical protein
MKMGTLAISWRHTFLNYAQFGPVEQVPALARRTPLIALRRFDVDYLKQGASNFAGNCFSGGWHINAGPRRPLQASNAIVFVA